MGLLLSPTVASSDGSSLILPGRSSMAGAGGMALKVNAAGDGYELGAGGGGGAPVATAQVYGDPATVSGSSTALDYQAVRYAAPYNGFTSSKPDMDLSWLWIDAVNPSRINLAAGVYSAVCEFNLAWGSGEVANAPGSFRPILYHGGEGEDFNFQWFPKVTDNSGRQGLFQVLHSHMVWSDGTGPSAGSTWAYFQLQLSHTTAGAYPASGSKRIIWQITKWA